MHYELTIKQFRVLALDFAQVKKILNPGLTTILLEKTGITNLCIKTKLCVLISLQKPQTTSLACSTSFKGHNVFTSLEGLMEREHFPPKSQQFIIQTTS